MQILFVVLMCGALSFTLALLLLRHLHRDKLYVKTRIKFLFGSRANNEARHKLHKQSKKNQKMRMSLKGKLFKALTTELSLAGIRLRGEEFLCIWAASILVPAGITVILRLDWLVTLGLVIMGLILPYLFVKRAKSKRLVLFEQQLSDALMIMGNCLRTGLSFQQAIGSIASDMPEPISKEFARVAKEVQLGVMLEKALENMVERLNSKDLMLIVAAVLIQRQVGGNLSEILDGISDTIRERLKIKSSIKVMTATGRTSGFIVGLMPVFLMLVLMLINPPYVRSFFESTLGITLLSVAGGLEIIGFLIVKKVVNIKF